MEWIILLLLLLPPLLLIPTSTTIKVPVTKDIVAEELEAFDLTFIIPPSLSNQVILGKITKAVGVITDDTSKMVW